MKPVFRLLLVAIFSCALTPRAAAQVVNRPPVPEWISASDNRPNQTVTFQKEFLAPATLLKSVLLGVAEGVADVQLNGLKVGQLSGAAKAAGFDVTAHVKPGQTNLLSVRVLNPTNAASLAVLLELNADLARQSWLISDATWRANTQPARSLGRTDARLNNPFAPDKAVDAYNSWKLASGAAQATDPATFTLLPGFKAELVRSARPEEGSWIALAFDPQGRLTLSREKKGLLRLTFDSRTGVPPASPSNSPTPPQGAAGKLESQAGSLTYLGWPARVEVINDTLLECRGLLYAHGALYANANNSKTLVRLRDTKGTGQFDETTELLKTEGGVGHGRNHLKLGPDGGLWIAHGNNVQVPKKISTNSPLPNCANDRLIPCRWEPGMFDGHGLLPGGHILRMKPDSSEVQLWAGGLRNPMDIAFNEHGDLFTFDADMEWDVGSPWYMPNRVLHVVPGADYGWRRGTGRWPAWYPDTLPSVVDIGLASPTGVIFGHGAKFPAKYQKALFLCDWAYGRILAVHLTPQGASYTGTSELFVGGRPMNVTDACIGPDGAMWFTTGGRGTQSGLYRVTAIKEEKIINPASVAAAEDTLHGLIVGGEYMAPDQFQTFAERVRLLLERRVIAESSPSGLFTVESAVSKNLLAMGSPYRWIRHAANFATERLPTKEWERAVLSSSNEYSLLFGSLALTRSTAPESKAKLLNRLLQERVAGEDVQIVALRVLALTFIRLGPPDDAQRQAALNWLEPLYPNASPRVNQMLVELLVYLRSPQVVAKTVPLLRAATASEDLLHYPFYLRYAREGWTPDARRAVFDALDRAERLSGGRTYFTSIANVRKELLASLTPEERVVLAPVLNVTNRTAAFTAPPPRFVKDWKLADLEPRLAEVGKVRSYEGARTALLIAQCVHCHRVSNDPAFPNSVIGPELLAVGARFSRRDLLFHILEPSAVIDEKFRQPRLLLKDGDDVSGMIEREADGKLFVRPNPLEEKLVEVPLANIRERRLSDVSPMPSGLLNGLRLEQILDLLAYLEAAGDPKHRDFQP